MSSWKPIRKMPELTLEERDVLLNRSTETPHAGKYTDFWEKGVYLCRQCGNTLFRSDDKFTSDCGWAAFDREIPDAVTRQPDPDGIRVEIVCANCGGHLGHVFEGERLTPRNVRHCVNSLSITWARSEQALFAGGCFWGVEAFFSAREGVFTAISGYAGGRVENPTYRQVCGGHTGHAESVLLEYDPDTVSYERLVKDFFELHDPTQINRQGADIGEQYRSIIFYFDKKQKRVAEKLRDRLMELGWDVVTEIIPAGDFYTAEEYHQHYFAKHASIKPDTCHIKGEIGWD